MKEKIDFRKNYAAFMITYPTTTATQGLYKKPEVISKSIYFIFFILWLWSSVSNDEDFSGYSAVSNGL